MQPTFHLPVRPYTPIDAYNRRAAAVGTPALAMSASRSNFNGHHVTLSWNEYRQYYVTQYFWAGSVVLGRGKFEACLIAALAEYARGALGASAEISPRADDTAAIELLKATPEVVEGSLWTKKDGLTVLAYGDWYTWRHDAAAACAKDRHTSGVALIFDMDLLNQADSREAYEESLKAKYGKAYR